MHATRPASRSESSERARRGTAAGTRAARRLLSTALAWLALQATLAAPAEGQWPRNERIHLSDVSGTLLTSLNRGEPGTIKSFSCPVAWAVRTVATDLEAVLDAGMLRVTDGTAAGRRVPAPIQNNLAEVLGGRPGRRQAAAAVVAALTPAANSHRGAQRAARQLVDGLDGLIRGAYRLNPERPTQRDYMMANRVATVVGAYNRFIDVSSIEFLSAAPLELLAIQAMLSQTVIAAVEADGPIRVCGPPPPPRRPPPPPPPIELAASICMMLDNELREVPAILVPARGDTLVVIDGERRRFSEVYRETEGYANVHRWFYQDEPIELMNRRYVKYGLPQIRRPEEMTRITQHRGVSVFVERGVPTLPAPEVIYLPVRIGCEVQPYRPEEGSRG